MKPLASGYTPPSWPDVPALVGDWVTFASSPPGTTHLMVHLAEAHAHLERIHPFLDGNGRTGRLVLNLMLVRRGYPPALIHKTSRMKYLKALRRADRDEDPGPLAELLARAVKHGIDRFVLPGLAGPHRLVPLTALAGPAGLSLLALRRAAARGRLKALRKTDQWYPTRQWMETYKKSRRRGPRRRSAYSGPAGA